MNFLAHCALADLAGAETSDPTGLIAGGVLADFRRGPVPEDWPQALQLGVRLHRRVDAASNALDGIRLSCSRFPAPLRRYAPILVDIHADRSLALRWPNYHSEPLPEFSARCYGALDAYQPQAEALHEGARRFLSYMREQDLLANYDKWRHVEQGVQSVFRRLRKRELAGQAIDALHAIDTSLTEDFEGYFAELTAEAKRFVLANS